MALYSTFEEAKLSFNEHFFNEEGQLLTEENAPNDLNKIVRQIYSL